eukprot:1167530_1
MESFRTLIKTPNQAIKQPNNLEEHEMKVRRYLKALDTKWPRNTNHKVVVSIDQMLKYLNDRNPNRISNFFNRICSNNPLEDTIIGQDTERNEEDKSNKAPPPPMLSNIGVSPIKRDGGRHEEEKSETMTHAITNKNMKKKVIENDKAEMDHDENEMKKKEDKKLWNELLKMQMQMAKNQRRNMEEMQRLQRKLNEKQMVQERMTQQRTGCSGIDEKTKKLSNEIEETKRSIESARNMMNTLNDAALLNNMRVFVDSMETKLHDLNSQLSAHSAENSG